jgi:Family of unknown function (DUF6812)
MSDTRRQRVVVETERQRIVGEVILPAEGFRTRLSDLLNSEGLRFVSLINATVTDHATGDAIPREFIAVARDHVQVAYEEDPS